MQKKVTISIDDELNERWGKVAKKLKDTKSSMVEDFLIRVLPVLEREQPKDMIGEAMKLAGQGLQDAASLFDADRDQSIEDYKKMKRG